MKCYAMQEFTQPWASCCPCIFEAQCINLKIHHAWTRETILFQSQLKDYNFNGLFIHCIWMRFPQKNAYPSVLKGAKLCDPQATLKNGDLQEINMRNHNQHSNKCLSNFGKIWILFTKQTKNVSCRVTTLRVLRIGHNWWKLYSSQALFWHERALRCTLFLLIN